MRQMQSVLWTKGLLLSPQHLQTQDKYLEDSLGFRLRSHVSFPWGFSHLKIDDEAIAGGLFRLTGAMGLFPDGLSFDVPGADPAPEPKPIADYWDPDRDRLDLYLAIPERRLDGHNVAVGSNDTSARYVAESTLRRDENTGLTELPVQVARKNFRVLADSEVLDGHSILKVARIRRSLEGDWRLDPTHIPPLLDIGASDHLLAMTRRLVEVLTTRGNALARMRRERAKGVADFGIMDVANFWFLYTLNSHLPVIRHILEVRRGHAGGLYRAMLSLAGTLSTFSGSIAPADLPAYDHTDLTMCFGRMDELLHRLLDTVVPSSHVALPFSVERPTIHQVSPDRDRYYRGPEVYLAVQAGVQESELVQKVPQLIKLTSPDRIDQLVSSARDGVSLVYAPDPPPAVPIRLGYQYFRLDRSGPDWDAIRRTRSLAAYVPDVFPEARLELVILLPAEE